MRNTIFVALLAILLIAICDCKPERYQNDDFEREVLEPIENPKERVKRIPQNNPKALHNKIVYNNGDDKLMTANKACVTANRECDEVLACCPGLSCNANPRKGFTTCGN